MKKINQTFRKKLKMPYLFREDLEAIEKIIKIELKPQEYKLSTKEYEYDNVESIPKNFELINEFHIKTDYPYISIDFYGHDAQIYAGDDNVITVGAVIKIIKIISKRERKILWYCCMLSSLILLPLYFFLLISQYYDKNRITIILFLLWSLLMIIWMVIIIFYINMYRFSVINFNYSKENPNFIKRNKDQIILIIFGAMFGAIVTLIIQNVL